MTRLRQLACDVWILAKGYWRSEERWSARVLLTSIIGLNLGLVGVNVLQNQANGALFTALQQRNAPGFYRAFVIVIVLILLYLVVAVLRVYLDQTLQLRWRRWLTDQYVTRWLANRTFYRMRFSGRVDNPDQRISEDVRLFIQRSMFLGLGFLNSLATLASFAALLWYLSGNITLPIGGFAITIPGYMFWVAVLYSGFGSAIAHLIGRPLIRLNNRQQAVEADFRFSLVRLREEAEGIALYGGEAQERGIALGRFRTLYDNFKRIILCGNQYLMFQLLFSQGTSSFALLIASPRYFSGAIQLGVLIQIANAFERVNEALSWFIASYTAFAEWRATVDRLTEFAAEIKRETAAAVLGPRTETAVQDTIDLAGCRRVSARWSAAARFGNAEFQTARVGTVAGTLGQRQEHALPRPRGIVAVRDRAYPPAGRRQDAVSAAAALHADRDLGRGVVVSRPAGVGPEGRGAGGIGRRRVVQFEPTLG
jgi:putative ATP-binding cassette transporter